MRKLMVVTPALFLLAACASTANVPPIVTWSYGAGNGDGVKFPGPPPKYSWDNGMGGAGGTGPVVSYAYGAESTKGNMIRMTAPEKQQIAAPVQAAGPNTHS